MNKKLIALLSVAAVIGLGAIVARAGSSTVTGKNAAGSTVTFDVTTDASSQLVPWQVICDATAAAQCAAVKAASTSAAQTDPAAVVRNPDVGATSDSAYAGSGSASVIAALKGIYSALTSAIPAGTNVIGGVFGSPNVTPTDCSGTITTGGTAQTLIASAATIHGFQLQNIDASAGSGEALWFSLTTTAAAATAASYGLIPPASTTTQGGAYATPMGFGVNHAVSIVAATTGHKFSCTSW